jgi:serine/threonine-protein phosphatase CPPED1
MRQCLLPLLFAAAALAQQPFSFIQMSDPQFGMYTANQGFAHETANFEFAIATANRLRPAFVIVTGDLVNKPGDPAQVAEYQRIAAKLDRSIRLYNVPGNHDLENEPTPGSLAAYRTAFGPDYYTFRSGGMAGFVLDSMLEKAPQGPAAEAAKQERWLRAELAKARQDGVQHLIVFQHHPFFLESAAEPSQYFNIPPETRQRYLAMFKEFGVQWIFAGHYHRNAVASAGAIHMVTTGPVGKPLGGSKSGIRIVTLQNGTLAHTYYEFGDLPDAIQ